MIAGIYPIYSWSFVKDVVFEFLLNPRTLVGKIKSIYHFWDHDSAFDTRWRGIKQDLRGVSRQKAAKIVIRTVLPDKTLFVQEDKTLAMLGGGFKHFYFHPYLAEWSKFTNIFQMGSNQQLETLDYGFLYFVESNYYEDVDTPSHHPLPIGLEDSKSWPKKKNMTTLQKKNSSIVEVLDVQTGCCFFFTREFWWFRIFHPVVSSDVSSYHFGPTFPRSLAVFNVWRLKMEQTISGPRKNILQPRSKKPRKKKQKNFKGFDRFDEIKSSSSVLGMWQ